MGVELLEGSTIVGFVEDEEAFNKWVTTRFTALDTNRDGFLSYDDMVEELKKLRPFETEIGNHTQTHPDEVVRTYKSMFNVFDRNGDGLVDFQGFKDETKNIMLAIADALGFMPFHVVLHQDSLLFQVLEWHNNNNNNNNKDVVAN